MLVENQFFLTTPPVYVLIDSYHIGISSFQHNIRCRELEDRATEWPKPLSHIVTVRHCDRWKDGQICCRMLV